MNHKPTYDLARRARTRLEHALRAISDTRTALDKLPVQYSTTLDSDLRALLDHVYVVQRAFDNVTRGLVP